MPQLSIHSPFDTTALVTTSSTHGHHRPYGGNVSCDMDVLVPSRGTPVAFDPACHGIEVRAVVESIRPACRSGKPEDGGFAVLLRLQRLDEVGWVETGLRLLFAHLDPVTVEVGDVLPAGGARIGALGPAVAQRWPDGSSACGARHGRGDPCAEEYHSSCAVHSHLHVEAFGAERVVGRGARLERGADVVSFTLAGSGVSRPDEEVEEAPRPSTYVVARGDTLVEIAARLGVVLPRLLNANPDLVQVGQVLHVPGHTYEVCPRDTLGEIARRFGVTLQALASANAIADVDVIRVGQVLVIPR
ncbi:MAG: LysM peptidoglycan-binding domain-containing protein [Dehalococcoidia bacterium]|nr:LysM peptidoglycan-binding domain-containing protein [Dehalococcoidia bacterium]